MTGDEAIGMIRDIEIKTTCKEFSGFRGGGVYNGKPYKTYGKQVGYLFDLRLRRPLDTTEYMLSVTLTDRTDNDPDITRLFGPDKLDHFFEEEDIVERVEARLRARLWSLVAGQEVENLTSTQLGGLIELFHEICTDVAALEVRLEDWRSGRYHARLWENNL